MRKLQTLISISLLALLLSCVYIIGNMQESIEKQTKDIEGLKTEIFDKNSQLEKQQGEINTQKENIDNLLKQNDILKKEVQTWKDKSESPSVKKKTATMPSRGEPAKKAVVFEATQYVAMCDTGCTGITATGYDVRNTTKVNGLRVIAVDPKVIPLYSIVKVQTKDRTFNAIALDTGGAIKGHKIDILTSSTDKAWNFGRQNVSVTILRAGKG